MKDNLQYFIGLALVIHSNDAGLLLHRGFRFPGATLAHILSFMALACWIAGFFVGTWWAPLAVIPLAVVLGTIKLFILNAITQGDPDALPALRYYSALLSGLIGAACIGMWWL